MDRIERKAWKKNSVEATEFGLLQYGLKTAVGIDVVGSNAVRTIHPRVSNPFPRSEIRDLVLSIRDDALSRDRLSIRLYRFDQFLFLSTGRFLGLSNLSTPV